MRGSRIWALLLAASVLTLSSPALAHGAVVDAHAEVAAALFAASATQAAESRAASARISAERAQIVVLAAKVRANAAQRAQLIVAEEGFVTELAAKDRSYAEAIEAFRGAVIHITATPEGLAALHQFNNGDEVGALAIIGRLNDVRDAAEQKMTDVEKAVGRRDQAELALEARARGKLNTATVTALFEQVTRLDPGSHWDWVVLSRLYRDAGRLADAEKAGESAVLTSSIDAQRNEGLLELGDVRDAEGNLAGANQAYQVALSAYRGLALANPGRTDLQTGIEVCLGKIGDVRMEQGDLVGAGAAYGESLQIVRGLVAAAPGDQSAQRDLVVSLYDDANLLAAQNDLAGSAKTFDEAVATARAMASADPGNLGLQGLVGRVLQHRGAVLVLQRDFTAALVDLRESAAIGARVSAADPDNVDDGESWATSLEDVGAAAVMAHDWVAGDDAFQQDISIRQRLADADPGNGALQGALSATLKLYGQVLVGHPAGRQTALTLAKLAAMPNAGVAWSAVARAWRLARIVGEVTPADQPAIDDAERRAAAEAKP